MMRRAVVALYICGTLAGTGPHPLFAFAEQARRFRAGDKELRDWAVTSPPPVYPAASLDRKVAGLVAATLRIDPKGKPEAVHILQSPDPATGRAVQDVLMQWTFRPVVDGGEGTLFFYFFIKGGTGVVLSPLEMRQIISPGAKTVERADEPPTKHITEAEFRALSAKPSTLLLDIRDRETFSEDHEKNAVNIPLSELLWRAPAELPVTRHVVLDCRDPQDYCAMAVHQLNSWGFAQVSVLDRR